MSAVLEYIIRSKDDSGRGVDSALTNSTRLQSGIEKISQRIKKAFAIGGVLLLAKKIKDLSARFTNLYGVQEKAEKVLVRTFRNTGISVEENFPKFKELASHLQKINGIGDEVTLSMMATTQQLAKLDSEGLSQVIPGIQDFASSMKIDMVMAAKMAGQTIGSNTNALARYGIQIDMTASKEEKLAQLTEQLTSKFGGMAQTIAGTLPGKTQSFFNKLGDIGELIGGITAPIKMAALDKLMPVLEKIEKWLIRNQNKITNFFLHFPELAGLSFQSAKTTLLKYFQPEFLFKLGGVMWDNFKRTGWAAISTIGNFIKAIGTTLWEPIKLGFQWAAYGIKVGWQKMIDALVDILNFLMTPINSIVAGLQNVINAAIDAINLVSFWQKEEQKLGRVTFSEIKISGPSWDDIEKPESFGMDNIADAWKDVAGNYVDYLQSFAEGLEDLGDTTAQPVKEMVESLIPQFEKILNRAIPDTLIQDGKDGASVFTSDNSLAAAGKEIDKLIDGVRKIGQKFMSPIELKQQQIDKEIVEVNNLLSLLDESHEYYNEAEKILDNLLVEQKKLGEKLSNKQKGFFSKLFDKIFNVDLDAYAQQKGKEGESDLSGNEQFAARLSSVSSALLGVLSIIVNYFTGLIASTQTFQNAMNFINSTFVQRFELIANRLITAALPFIGVIDLLVSNVASFLIPVTEMFGNLIKDISPFLLVLGNLLVGLLDAVFPLIPPLLLIANILINTFTPILAAIMPVISLLGEIIASLNPLFLFLADGIKAVMIPVVIFAASIEWLVTKITALGNVILKIITFKFKEISSVDWGGSLSSTIAAALDNLNKTSDYSSTWTPDFIQGDSLLNNDLITGLSSGFESGYFGAAGGGGNSVTVTRPPDQYFNIYLEGTPVDGIEGRLVDINMLIELLKSHLGYDKGLTVYEGAR